MDDRLPRNECPLEHRDVLRAGRRHPDQPGAVQLHERVPLRPQLQPGRGHLDDPDPLGDLGRPMPDLADHRNADNRAGVPCLGPAPNHCATSGPPQLSNWVPMMWLGSGDELRFFVDGMLAAKASGVAQSVAGVSYPASNQYTVAVGASTDFGRRSDYSQYGADLDFVAPSSGGLKDIFTTDRTGIKGDDPNNYSPYFGGTSAATPLASGVAALMLSRNPQADLRPGPHDPAPDLPEDRGRSLHRRPQRTLWLWPDRRPGRRHGRRQRPIAPLESAGIPENRFAERRCPIGT